MPILGFHPFLFMLAAVVGSSYQFLIHIQSIGKFPRWTTYIFNSPSHHRVHHATNPHYLDKNYAAIFIFWDRLFGTNQEEEEEPVYGITHPLRSWNPFWANVHLFVDIYREMQYRKGFWNKLRLWFQSPAALAHLPAEPLRPEKYAPAISGYQRAYSFIQFAISVALMFFLFAYFEQLNWILRAGMGIWLLCSLYTLSLILESNRRGVLGEGLKWIALLLLLGGFCASQPWHPLQWIPVLSVLGLSMLVFLSIVAAPTHWRAVQGDAVHGARF